MWEGFETKKGGDQCTFSTAAVLFIMRRKDSMSLFYTSTYQGINKYDFRLNSEKFRQPCSSVARGRPESRKPAGLATAAAAAKSLQSCLTVQPHRRQPTRLCRPWDSPGKNTGVGCHCLLQCMKVKVKSLSRVQLFAMLQSCLTVQPHRLQPTRLLHPWGFPGKSAGVGCHCPLRLATAASVQLWAESSERRGDSCLGLGPG